MDIKKKKDKLKSLKNEVKDFHPLLDTLFHSMSEIRMVNYTHGTNEKGADFVLSRFDELLNDVYYIGIIVKTGKIQVDFTTIERQIDECSMQRYTADGNKSIIISEIWVITNETISNQAEPKINQKYKDKKIIFIECQNLIKWIDKYLPNYWLDYGAQTGKYLYALNRHIDDLDKQLNLVKCTTDPFYIEQDIYRKESGYSQKNKHIKPIDIHEIINTERMIFIEAEMGGGKSKLLRKLTKHYSEGEIFAETNILPIHMHYKDIVEKYDFDIDSLLNAELGEETLTELNSDYRMLFLIDAVDERKQDIEEQVSSLKRLVETLLSNKRITAVFTSRPFQDQEDNHFLIENVKYFEIHSLTIKQIVQFLYKICQLTNISNRIIEDLKRSALFKQLPRTPIAAMILANLLNESAKELPSNMTELYSKYTELMLGRWDIEKGLQSQKEYESADSIIMILSEYFIDNNLPSISISEAKIFFSDYLKRRNLDITPENLYNKVIKRSGLLVENEQTQTIFFKHKTFAEFMYAKLREKNNDLIIDNRAFNIYWDIIFYFFIGLKKDCPEIINQIIDLKPVNEAQRWNRIINLSNYFLAGFASPYDVVENNLFKLLLEASALYKQIVERKVRSPFSFLPEIHVLFLFQYIIRESYSYEYFEKALDSTRILIDESSLPDAQKMYALFFIGVIAMELNKKDPFDFLLEKYTNRIPIQISLGISHEAEHLKHISALVKRSNKKIRRLKKSSKSSFELIKSMYESPIEARKIT